MDELWSEETGKTRAVTGAGSPAIGRGAEETLEAVAQAESGTAGAAASSALGCAVQSQGGLHESGRAAAFCSLIR